MMTKKVITQAVTLLSIVFFSAMAIPIPTEQTIVEDSNLSLFSYNGSEGSLTISISSFSSTIGFDVVPPASPTSTGFTVNAAGGQSHQ